MFSCFGRDGVINQDLLKKRKFFLSLLNVTGQ